MFEQHEQAFKELLACGLRALKTPPNPTVNPPKALRQRLLDEIIDIQLPILPKAFPELLFVSQSFDQGEGEGLVVYKILHTELRPPAKNIILAVS